jgi:type VI protein secretion system component Hcp
LADDHNNEILMQMIDANGNTLAAESRTAITTDMDDLALDYTDGTFFTVDDFAFGMNIDDKDQTSDGANASGKQGVGAAGIGKTPGPTIDFGKWKSADPKDLKGFKFPLRMDQFSLTRRYDRLSPVLFEKCAISESLTSASMLKRKVVGGDLLQTFLRLDFTDVLITHIEWTDAEVIKETIKFVFRKLTVQYKTQKPSGKLNAAGSVSWEYDTKLRK